jgi:hypothetical protein
MFINKDMLFKCAEYKAAKSCKHKGSDWPAQLWCHEKINVAACRKIVINTFLTEF